MEEEVSFEEALNKLETLVRELEAGRIKLDDAVKFYDDAVRLRKFCEQKLDDAKMKIEKIEVSSSGELVAVALDANDA